MEDGTAWERSLAFTNLINTNGSDDTIDANDNESNDDTGWIKMRRITEVRSFITNTNTPLRNLGQRGIPFKNIDARCRTDTQSDLLTTIRIVGKGSY